MSNLDASLDQKATIEQMHTADAKVTIRLIADSGYRADLEERISPEQWGRICGIIAEGNA